MRLWLTWPAALLLRALPRAHAARARARIAASRVCAGHAAKPDLGRTRFVAAAREPPCAIARRRALHGSSSSSKSSQRAARSAHAARGASPRTARSCPSEDDVDRRVHRRWRNRVAVDAAPRNCIASATLHRVGAAQLNAARASKKSPALATPRVAAEPTAVRLTTRRRVSAGVAIRRTTFPRPPPHVAPRITPPSPQGGE